MRVDPGQGQGQKKWADPGLARPLDCLRLAQKEAISLSDKLWLDNEGNTVDKLQVLNTLESASDYDKAVEQLDEKGKMIVQKLQEWADDMPKAVGNKYKCM